MSVKKIGNIEAEIKREKIIEGIEIIKFGSKSKGFSFEKSMSWFWFLFERTIGLVIGNINEKKTLELIHRAGFESNEDPQEFLAEFRRNFTAQKVPDIFKIKTKLFNQDSSFMQYFCRHVANAQALDCVYNATEKFSWNGRTIQPLEIASDRYACFYMNCPIGQSVRNRCQLVSYLVQKIGGGKMLSVACGSAQPMIHATWELARKGKEVSLLLSDVKQDSLDIARERVFQAGIQDHVFYLKSNSFALRNKLKGQKFDCIEMCGIFDYLTDKYVLRLLEFALSVLNQDGEVIVSNMINACGAAGILRKMYNWEIITRTPLRLGQLIDQVGGKNIKVYEEPWGIFSVATFCQ